MGGFGSGRTRDTRNSRAHVEKFTALRMPELYAQAGRKEDQLYLVLGEWLRKHHVPGWVDIQYTECHFGRRRPWLLCPECSQRRTTLYLEFVKGKGELFCRVCGELAYEIQAKDWSDRRTAAAGRIYIRLLRGQNLLNLLTSAQNILGGTGQCPPRPPGMHRATYARLSAAYNQAHEEGMERAMARAGAAMGDFEEYMAKMRDRRDLWTPEEFDARMAADV